MVRRIVSRAVKGAVGRLGYRLVSNRFYRGDYPLDLDDDFRQAHAQVSPFTMTPVERLYAVWNAAQHIARRRVAGAIVECGVWRGGGAMTMALALLRHGDRERHFHLFDTFTGMAEPSKEDREVLTGTSARDKWRALSKAGASGWAVASLGDAKANLGRVAYPSERFHLVPGKIEETVPARAPRSIALLRIDTSLHASTAHVLRHLYPRLASGGVLIVDGYGHWEGVRKAVDDHVAADSRPPLFHRTDYSGRVAVKD